MEHQDYEEVFNYDTLTKHYLDMLKLWQKEKFNEMILPYNEEIVNYSLYNIEKKKDQVKSTKFTEDNDFFKELIELDISRYLYLIQDYYRIRLSKIEKYMFYIIKNDLSQLLCSSEFDYLFSLFKLQRAYFNQNIYKYLNSSLNDMTNISNQIIITPNIFKYMFAICLSSEGLVVNIKDNYPHAREGGVILKKGDIVCIQENLLKPYLESQVLAFV